MGIQGNYFHRDHAFLHSGSGVPISLKPFTSLDLESEPAVIDWLKVAAKELSDYYGGYRRLQQENIGIYAGDSLKDDGLWDGRSLVRPANAFGEKTNMLRPLVETHVSRLSGSRAFVSVLPVHSSEFADLSASKTAESMLNMSFLDRKVDQKCEDAARCMLVCGAAYMLVEWDNTIGPPMKSLEEGLPVLDDNGNPKMDEDNNPIMMRPDIRIGDVNYRVLRPDQVLEQPGRWGDNVDWVIVMDMVDVYKLREQYPTLADQIKPADSDLERRGFMRKEIEQQTPVYTLYHKATPSLPHGRMISCTPDVILENVDLPYPSLNKYGLLPIARLHDMQLPGFALPLPLTVMESAKPYQKMHNDVDRHIRRNLSLQAPKWIVNQGAGVRLSHLNSGANIVQYKGDASMAPSLQSPATTPAEMFNYRSTLGSEMQQVSGASHAFNTPPPNTRAASMLEHQEEQEFRRAEPLIKHYNNFQSDIGKIALGIMADKYDEADGRMLKLTAHGSSTAFMRLQVSDLMGPFDIKFERTSALPESKQGRLNEAARLFQSGLIDEQQYKKIIGYDADPELADAKTKAFEKQLLEIDLITRQHQIQPPLEHEDHVEHLRALYPLIQSIEFGEMPPEIQAQIVSHAMAHEMFAWKRAQVSQIYALRVLEHVHWLFFSALPEAMPVGMGNPGTPIENLATERLTTPGLTKPSEGILPGPENPEAV